MKTTCKFERCKIERYVSPSGKKASYCYKHFQAYYKEYTRHYYNTGLHLAGPRVAADNRIKLGLKQCTSN